MTLFVSPFGLLPVWCYHDVMLPFLHVTVSTPIPVHLFQSLTYSSVENIKFNTSYYLPVFYIISLFIVVLRFYNIYFQKELTGSGVCLGYRAMQRRLKVSYGLVANEYEVYLLYGKQLHIIHINITWVTRWASKICQKYWGRNVFNYKLVLVSVLFHYRHVVREILLGLDPEGVACRRKRRLRRRRYTSQGPLHAIHIDGYDKVGWFINGHDPF